MNESHASVGLYLGENARMSCLTYEDSKPILSLEVGDLAVTLTPRGRKAIKPCDVENARVLLDAVGVYLAECERLALQQAAETVNTKAEAA